MSSKEEIFKQIVEIISREFGFAPERLLLETHLIDDLDMDSIDAIDLAVRIEEKTNLLLSEEELLSIQTIEDAVDLVHQRLQ